MRVCVRVRVRARVPVICIHMYAVYANVVHVHATQVFTGVSAGTFIALTLAFYWIYGWEFVHAAYLYHISRADHRHNLSVYFYRLYLDVCGGGGGGASPGEGGGQGRLLLPLLAFLPQVLWLLACI